MYTERAVEIWSEQIICLRESKQENLKHVRKNIVLRKYFVKKYFWVSVYRNLHYRVWQFRDFLRPYMQNTVIYFDILVSKIVINQNIPVKYLIIVKNEKWKNSNRKITVKFRIMKILQNSLKFLKLGTMLKVRYLT